MIISKYSYTRNIIASIALLSGVSLANLSAKGQTSEDFLKEMQSAFVKEKAEDMNCCRDYLSRTLEGFFSVSDFHADDGHDIPAVIYQKVSKPDNDWDHIGNADEQIVLYQAQLWANLGFAVVAFYVDESGVPGVPGVVLPLQSGIDNDMQVSQRWDNHDVPRAIVFNQSNATSVNTLMLSKITNSPELVEIYVRRWAQIGPMMQYSIDAPFHYSNQEIKVKFRGLGDVYVGNPYLARTDKVSVNGTVEYSVMPPNKRILAFEPLVIEGEGFSLGVPIIVLKEARLFEVIGVISYPKIKPRVLDIILDKQNIGADLWKATSDYAAGNPFEVFAALVSCGVAKYDPDPLSRNSLMVVCMSTAAPAPVAIMQELIKARTDRALSAQLITQDEAKAVKAVVSVAGGVVKLLISKKLSAKYVSKLPPPSTIMKRYQDLADAGDIAYDVREDLADPNDLNVKAGKYIWGQSKLFFYFKPH